MHQRITGIILAGLLCAECLAQATVAPAQFLSAASVAIDCWSKEDGYVGNPNSLNRQDRTVVCFDLTPWLAAGRVQAARLEWKEGFTGIQADGNDIIVERLARWREKIAAQDAVAGDAVQVWQYHQDAGKPNPRPFSLELTALVNQLLAEGRSCLVLRFRNATIEKEGNRTGAAECVILTPGNIVLNIKD